MPGDETYIHLIDAVSAQGPLWLFVAGVLVICAFIAVKALPVVRDVKRGELDIGRQREERKAEEVRLRDERERENAANAARMVDAMNRQADGDQAMAAALNAISARLDASQGRSAHMGEQVDEMQDTLHGVALQVGEIHAATTSRDSFKIGGTR